MLLQKAFVQTFQKKEDGKAAPAEVEEVAAAQAEQMREVEEKPWTGETEYTHVITGRPVVKKLLSFHNLGDGLLGRTSRAGVVSDTKEARLALNGIGGIDRPDAEVKVYPAKSEEFPRGLPFMSQRRSGEQYWADDPRKPRRTQIF